MSKINKEGSLVVTPEPSYVNREIITKWTRELKDRELEKAYRTAMLERNAIFLRTVIIYFVTFLSAVSFFDYLVIKPQYTDLVLGWRIFLILLGGVLILYTAKIKTLSQYDWLPNTCAIIGLMNSQVSLWFFRDDYIFFVIFEIVILISIYFSMLMTFKSSCIVGLLYCVTGTITVAFFKQAELHSSILTFFAYLATNGIGMTIASSAHTQRRVLFYQQKQTNELNDVLQEQALKDPLTKIPNRRAFDEDYEQYIKAAQRQLIEEEKICVILADIDHFKRVNDRYGHNVGDQVLIEFAELLISAIRPMDKVYRFGGEEFLIVLCPCTKESAINRIEQIILRLNQNPLHKSQLDKSITSSFGLTVLRPEDDKRDVLTRADNALYKAKNNGRNQLVCD